MRGHIRKRGGSWQALVKVRDENGRERQLSGSAPTKRGAEAILARLLGEAAAGKVPGGEARTFQELIEEWFGMAAPDFSPRTADVYRWIIDRYILPRVGRIRLARLHAADLDRFYGALRREGGRGGRSLSPKTVRYVHAICHRALDQGVRWGWLLTNPASLASPPRLPRRAVAATETSAVVKLVEEAEVTGDGFGAFLRLAAATGARRGELCAIRWTDVDFERASVTIARSVVHSGGALVEKGSTKTGVARRVALDPDTLTSLRVHRHRVERRAAEVEVSLAVRSFVFSDELDGSEPWAPNRVTRRFIRLRDRLGFGDIRLHDLRHHLATQLLTAGIPVRTVSERLGHANANVTLGIYAHFVPASDREAAEVAGGLLRPSPE